MYDTPGRTSLQCSTRPKRPSRRPSPHINQFNRIFFRHRNATVPHQNNIIPNRLAVWGPILWIYHQLMLLIIIRSSHATLYFINLRHVMWPYSQRWYSEKCNFMSFSSIVQRPLSLVFYLLQIPLTQHKPRIHRTYCYVMITHPTCDQLNLCYFMSSAHFPYFHSVV